MRVNTGYLEQCQDERVMASGRRAPSNAIAVDTDQFDRAEKRPEICQQRCFATGQERREPSVKGGGLTLL